jgi:hypothetical protein
MKQVANQPLTKARKADAITKHGEKKRGKATIEYKTWLRMKSRCYRKTDKNYNNWGGRGIRVCEAWLHDFPKFLEDMGRRPEDKESIDRIDPNGHYEPANCRWASMHEQVTEHCRAMVSITIDGIEFPSMAAACRHIGLSPTTLNERLRAGYSLEQAFTSKRLKPRRSRESYLKKNHPDRS